MTTHRLIVAVALAIATRASIAAACECSVPPVFVSGASPALGPESTLYLFVPVETEPRLLPAITATQGETKLAIETEEIARTKDGSVRRIRIHGATPGELSLAYLDGDPETWKVVDHAPASVWPHVRGLEHSGNIGLCESTGPVLELAGDRAAAFRLRWTDAGQPREAYLPAARVWDDDGLPIRGAQYVRIGYTGCGANWLGVVLGDGVTLEGAELTMLGVDGDETVVLRGAIELRADAMHAGTFAVRPPPPSPPPPAALPAPPAARIVWWRIFAGTGGGITLGAMVGWLALLRRRR